MPKYKDPNTGAVTIVGNPDLNPDLIAGKTLVGDTITADSLASETPIDFQTVNETPVYPVAGLGTQLLQPTAPEQQAQSFTEQIQALNEQLLGQSELRATEEEEADIVGLTKTQQDLQSRLKAIQNEALAIPLQLQQEAEGRGITKAGLAPIQTGRLRTNAIQALGTASLLEASRGNLTLALDLVDRAVAQKYDPIREQIAVARANLDLILESPAFTLAEKNRAIAQKDIQDAKASAIAKQEANDKAISNYAIEAVRFGADAEQAKYIQESQTPEQALQRASSFLGREFAEEQKAKQFTRTLQEMNYNLSVDKFNEDIRQFGEQQALELWKIDQAQIQENIEKLAEQGEEQKVQSLIADSLKLKLDSYDRLKNPETGTQHKGMAVRVGPSKQAREGTFIGIPFTKFALGSGLQSQYIELTGAGQEFAGIVHQLTSRATLDELINVKAQGATFGALQKAELDKLEESASKINDWEIKDKNGEGTGEWNIDEKSFHRELDIMRDIVGKARRRATGIEPMPIGEVRELELLNQSDEDLSDPLNYYN